MTENNDLPDLQALLKTFSADDEVAFTYAQTKALHAELQRLLQSNDRLRKQNRKVRVKYDRLRAGLEVRDDKSENADEEQP